MLVNLSETALVREKYLILLFLTIFIKKNTTNMQIQFNTDKTISGNERNQEYFTTLISKGLGRFEDHLTRVEAHLSDENGEKSGTNDIKCLLEARVEGKQPVVVTNNGDTVEKAISGAIDKMKNSLTTIIGRKQNR